MKVLHSVFYILDRRISDKVRSVKNQDTVSLIMKLIETSSKLVFVSLSFHRQLAVEKRLTALSKGYYRQFVNILKPNIPLPSNASCSLITGRRLGIYCSARKVRKVANGMLSIFRVRFLGNDGSFQVRLNIKPI